MPYDPGNPDEFRRILAKLSEELFLSSEKILNLARAARKGKDLPPFDMTRSALDRYKKGKRIKNIQGLREIWLVLEAHQDYAYCFARQNIPQSSGAVATFSSALTKFFLENAGPPSYDLMALADKIAGSYVMYRPDWRPRIPQGLARASLVHITVEDAECSISETQNFAATETERAFWQHDTGAMAPFGKYIYFLMKEDAPGTAVKFGLVTALFPNSRNSIVDWFRGVVFTSSNLNIYPLAQFFCRRIDNEAGIQLKLMKIEDIPDDDAKAFLKTPL